MCLGHHNIHINCLIDVVFKLLLVALDNSLHQSPLESPSHLLELCYLVEQGLKVGLQPQMPKFAPSLSIILLLFIMLFK